MGLILSKSKESNMYQFIDARWNTVKGKCPHGCSYCYMKRWGKQKPVRLDENELNTDLGYGRFIFVGSSCDMFADDIPDEWIVKTLEHCRKYNNSYMFQSKNPGRVLKFISGKFLPRNSVICTTIETNRYYPEIMQNCPTPKHRALEMYEISNKEWMTYATIEPIMDFDLNVMVRIIKQFYPEQVNIGADSGGNNLPEPNKEKILALIEELEQFTTVVKKKNLKRIIGEF